MARKPRVMAQNKVYHVILRGVNKQMIFFDDDDRWFMVQALYRLQWWEEKSGEQHFNEEENTEQHRSYTLYSYCLMDNHIHLLMKSEEEDIGCCVRRIGDAYVKYINERWNRVGHLFQGRFKSEPVEDISYFTTLLHYIHYNPVKAGMVASPVDYIWSSARELAGLECGSVTVCTSGSDPNVHKLPAIVHRRAVWQRMGAEEIREMLMTVCTAVCMEDTDKRDVTDEDVWDVIRKACGAGCSAEFLELDKSMQVHALLKCLQNEISRRRVIRLTGMSRRLGNSV